MKQKKTHRPYSKPEYLLKMYAFMQEYFKKNQRHVAISELVDAGFATSTSVVRYYFERMEEFGMIERTFGISRGVKILPPENFAPIIQQIMKTEVGTEPRVQIATEL